MLAALFTDFMYHGNAVVGRAGSVVDRGNLAEFQCCRLPMLVVHLVYLGTILLAKPRAGKGAIGPKPAGVPTCGAPRYSGSDKLRFKRPVVPGDKLQLDAAIVSEKRGIWKFDCRASVDGQLVASATILCADRKV